MKLVVIVPAYNAEQFLPNLVHRLLTARPPGLFRIVIVDDRSTDRTAETARDLAKANASLEVVVRPANGGYGAAMKDGLVVARRLDADRVAGVHADGQYSPEVLADLLAALDRQGLDLLQGSRIAGGQALAGGMPIYKYAGNWALNKIERWALALPLTDFHSGYLVYSRRALDAIPFGRLSNSFDFDIEAIATARARGLAVGESPIPTHYGDEVSYLNPFTYGLRVLRVLWRFKRGEYGA